MANNSDNNLSNKISDILLEQSNIKPFDVIKSVDRYSVILEKMLQDLSLIRANKKAIMNSSTQKIKKYTIEDFENEYSDDIEQIEAIISSSEESGIHSQSNYRKLQHNYYELKNEILICKTNNFSKTIKDVENKLAVLDYKSRGIEEKFEGIGSTILSTVVSLTVVVTAITAIEKISAIYIPLYLFSMVWLCMTLIVFINNLFNKNDFNSRQARILYIIISILVFIILICTLFYIKVNNKNILDYKPSKEIVLEEN